jgi:hypothetical protein
VMTPQLQMAIRMLGTPSAELGALIAPVKGLAHGGDGDDPLLVPDDDNPLTFVDRPGNLAIADADVWVAGNPPIARAIRAALPTVHVLPDLGAEDQREARWVVLALRQRARTFERVVGVLAEQRPRIAVAMNAADMKPMPVRTIAKAVGFHESTIQRVAACCRVQNLHRVFGLAIGKRGLALAD